MVTSPLPAPPILLCMSLRAEHLRALAAALGRTIRHASKRLDGGDAARFCSPLREVLSDVNGTLVSYMTNSGNIEQSLLHGPTHVMPLASLLAEVATAAPTTPPSATRCPSAGSPPRPARSPRLVRFGRQDIMPYSVNEDRLRKPVRRRFVGPLAVQTECPPAATPWVSTSTLCHPGRARARRLRAAKLSVKLWDLAQQRHCGSAASGLDRMEIGGHVTSDPSDVANRLAELMARVAETSSAFNAMRDEVSCLASMTRDADRIDPGSLQEPTLGSDGNCDICGLSLSATACPDCSLCGACGQCVCSCTVVCDHPEHERKPSEQPDHTTAIVEHFGLIHACLGDPKLPAAFRRFLSDGDVGRAVQGPPISGKEKRKQRGREVRETMRKMQEDLFV